MAEAEFVTFGCRLNTYESEVMRQHAEQAGVRNAVVFNTCAVTGEAARQARQAIRRLSREQPQTRIVVTGCAAQTNPDVFAAMPEVTRVMGNAEKLKAESWQGFDQEAPRVQVSNIMGVRDNHLHLIDRLSERTRAFVQIQNGCDHRCTFCIIPFGRGNSRSVPPQEVVSQIQRFVANGYQEVVLSGVDLTSWGADLADAPKLGTLVQTILRDVPEIKRLRLSSIDSIEVDPLLLDLILHERRIMPHIHLSLQAGDNLILKRMKRRHAREDTIAFCKSLKAGRPEIVFGADMIAGFPTESDVMFENSLAMIEACDLTYLHVFPFSPRPETAAARMPQVPTQIIRERARMLREKGQMKLAKFLSTHVGSTQAVLVETENMGRNDQFAQVRFKQSLKPGAIIRAEMISASATYLEARPAG